MASEPRGIQASVRRQVAKGRPPNAAEGVPAPIEAPTGFPWIRTIFAVAILALVYPAFLVFSDVMSAKRASDDEWVRTVQSDRAGAEAIRGAAGENYERRNANYQEQIDAAIAELRGGGRGLCAAAMFLGRSRATAAVEPLIAAARSVDIDNSSLSCVVGAIGDLGEIAVAAGYYEMWLQRDNEDLWRTAIMGYGEFGADAPASAVRALEGIMEEDNWHHRLLAVMSAAKIGESAESVLQAGAEDEHPMVRTEARNALRQLQ